MSDVPKSVLRALDIVARTSTIYPPPYAAELAGREKRVLGDTFGLSQFGVNLVTLKAGAWSSHRHWHEREDEFVYVLDGEITLIDDHGKHKLTPGMCAGFKAGNPNGHHLVNVTGKPATYLEVGTRSRDETAHYPEADMLNVKVDGKWSLRHKDGTPY
jgi:uncharacterized cupin superfamily protein